MTVDQIQIEGLKRTKKDIVLRELDITIGDTIHISNLGNRLEENEYNIMNLGLFTTARFNFSAWEGATNKVILKIEVKEDWYVFPFPIAELADRNFNVWWTTYNRSIKRLNYGLKFYHLNTTGRKDLLKTVLQFGFTKKYELKYNLPSINKAQTLGAFFHVLHTREKEIGFNTVDNRLLFHRNDDAVLMKRFRIGGGLTFRKKLDVTHRLEAVYRNHTIHGSILENYNPDFFLGQNKLEYFSLKYKLSIDKRDIKPYPMNGFYFTTSLTKNGVGFSETMNSTESIIAGQKYFSFGKKWSIALAAMGKVEWNRNKQPYYTSRGLGYFRDFIRGYEFYVIDGLDFAYLKKSFRFNFFEKTYHWGDYMKFDSFKKMPIKLFLVIHNEFGFVNNPYYDAGNPLSNELLWGAGIGLDIVAYYNRVFNLEYSRNHLGEHGFFLHWTFSF